MTVSCGQSQMSFFDRQRRHGFCSSHLSLEVAQDLQAWETRPFLFTSEELFRFTPRVESWPAACRFIRSLDIS